MFYVLGNCGKVFESPFNMERVVEKINFEN